VISTVAPPASLAERVDQLAWSELRASLDDRGFAVTQPLLSAAECAELAALFDGGRFRSTIDMARHRFGDGRYRYFDHPLPAPIGELRTAFYRRLAPVANAWSALLGGAPDAFPLRHDQLLERCRAAGQERPTPLILRYGEGDWNALHQDLYGDLSFPFQVLTVLSEEGEDYAGGQFVLMEQRPRAQSRAHVLTPPRGAFVIFPTQVRPNAGKRGYHRVGMRHGVSTVTAGQRTALGLIFLVPFVWLAAIPLQLLAFLMRALVFQYIDLTSIAAYATLYRAFSARTATGLSHAQLGVLVPPDLTNP